MNTIKTLFAIFILGILCIFLYTNMAISGLDFIILMRNLLIILLGLLLVANVLGAYCNGKPGQYYVNN